MANLYSIYWIRTMHAQPVRPTCIRTIEFATLHEPHAWLTCIQIIEYTTCMRNMYGQLVITLLNTQHASRHNTRQSITFLETICARRCWPPMTCAWRMLLLTFGCIHENVSHLSACQPGQVVFMHVSKTWWLERCACPWLRSLSREKNTYVTHGIQDKGALHGNDLCS